MTMISLSVAATVFLLTYLLLYRRGQRLEQKDRRIKDIRTNQATEQKRSMPEFSLEALKEKAAKKRKDKLRCRQISTTKNPDKQTDADRELMMADIPLTGGQFMLVRVGVGAVLALILAWACSLVEKLKDMQLLIALVGLILGMLLTRKFVTKRIQAKRSLFRDALPDIMDLLVVSVEAGLGFDSAILRLYEKDKSPLMQEMMRAIQDVQHGMSKKEAYGNMSARCQVKELTSFLNALIQAEQLGISIKSVLKTQSEQLREARRQRAEEKALKAPVKMLVPMVIFIFPVIFIILLGPAALNVIEVLG